MTKKTVYMNSKAGAVTALRDSLWRSITETANRDGKIDLVVALEAVHDVLGNLLRWLDGEDIDDSESLAFRPESQAFKIDSPAQWIENPGESMRRWRKHSKLRISDVARLTDMSISHLSSIECGKIMPSLKTLKLIISVASENNSP